MKKILLFGIVIALIGVVCFLCLRTSNETEFQNEINKLVQAYDEAIYLVGDTEAARDAANRILKIAAKMNEPRATEVRGLVRLAHLEIVRGTWGNQWRKKLDKAATMVSANHTIDRAEYLYYSGEINGRFIPHRFEEGLQQIQEAYHVSKNIQDDRTHALTCTTLSELNAQLNRRNMVMGNAYRGATVAKQHGQKSIRVRTLKSLIGDLVYLNRFSEADERSTELEKLVPNSKEAEYIAFQNNRSDKFLVRAKKFLGTSRKLRDLGTLSKKRCDKTGLFMHQLALAYANRDDYASCEKYINIAIPFFKGADDTRSLKAVSDLLNLSQLAQAEDVEKVDQLAEQFDTDNPDYYCTKALAFAYDKLGETKKSLYWEARTFDLQKDSQDDTDSLLRQTAQANWEAELQSRKQAAINEAIAAKTQKRIWILTTSLVLGLTVCFLLAGFSWLLRKQRNSLEETVKSRTTSLSMAIEAANAADQAKSDFLAQINHEIRNPLTAILGFCDLLSASSGNTKNEFVAGIEASSLHLRDLIDKILEVSKIESTGLEMNRIEFFPEKTVNDIADIVAEQAVKKGLRFDAVFKGDRSGRVWSDEIKIRQIALNLVANSIKFTEHGSITLSFELCDDEEDIERASLIIVVKDTGIGIDSCETKSVFGRFAKGRNGTDGEGSGLGLFIVRQLVNCLDGELELDSELGFGTEIRVSLPVELGTIRANEPEAIADGNAVESALRPKTEKRVLVVDDQEMIRTTLKLQLDSFGYECETTGDLSRILDLVENWRPDVVLLDLRMPACSGYEVFERIRQCNNPTVSVFAITGDATVSVQQKCLSLGFDGFITKPFRIDAIADILDDQKQAFDQPNGDTVPAPSSSATR